MSQHKILFTGVVGAGKTTAIAQISDVPPITTEQHATDEVSQKKSMTTVAMDYGSMKLRSGETLHLYGTPGQTRFNFIWNVLSNGCLGIIILVDHQAEDPLSDLGFYLENFRDFTNNNAVVVGISKSNYASGPTFNDYHDVLKQKGLNVAMFEVDVRKKVDVITLISALMYSLDPTLKSVSKTLGTG